MTTSSKIAVGIGVALFAIIGFVSSERRQQRLSAQKENPTLCISAPEQTAMGSVIYPVAPQYQKVSGLGMVLTAADCGEARLKEMEKQFQYGLVGGMLFFKAPPTQAARDTMVSLGFHCAATEPDCKQWQVNEQMPSLQHLLKLKPFLDQIEREECGQCG